MSTTNEIAEQLDRVYCVVRPYNQPSVRYPLIDTEVVAQKFTAEVVEFLTTQGVDIVNAYVPPQFGATGGGFLYELMDLLKNFKLISVIIRLVKGVLFLVEKAADSKYKKGNIYVHVNLFIQAKNLATTENYYDDISNRLGFLLKMAKTSAEMLQEKYPLFSFGFNVQVSIRENEFTANFSLNLADGEYKYRRISNIASHVRLTNAMNLDVSVARFGLFRHTISCPTLILNSPHRERDYRWIGDGKKYYTLLSDKLINEFKDRNRTMTYIKYFKKFLE